MRQPKTFLLLSVVVAILFMAVAYAAIQNITLTVSGNTVATPDQGNFKVQMDIIFPSSNPANANIYVNGNKLTDAGYDIRSTSCNLTVSGLKTAGDYVIIGAVIRNHGEIDAELSYTYQNSNKEYFRVTLLQKPTILFGETGDEDYFTFKVELIKTPIVEQTGDFTITMIAKPTHFNS